MVIDSLMTANLNGQKLPGKANPLARITWLMTWRIVPTLLIGIMVHEMLVSAFQGRSVDWFFVYVLLGFPCFVYYVFEWKNGRMTLTERVIWAQAAPLR